MKKPYHIVLVTIADLPEGAGNTSRLRRLVQALSRCGHQVEIWNEHALGVSPPATQMPAGEIEGVPFSFVLGSVERGSGFGMIRTKYHAVRNLMARVKDRARAGRLDVLWFNNLSYYDMQPLTSLARHLGVRTVQSYEDERLEVLDTGNRSLTNRLFALNSRLADRYLPKQADAIAVISDYLRRKYEPLAGSPDRLYLVPTIIDCYAWRCPEEVPTDVPSLLYSGSFSEQDEIENLIEALAVVKQSGRRFRMFMLGGNRRNSQAVEKARGLVAARGLADEVTMTGFVPLAEVRRHICQANLLINIRADGVWSRSGLSTKLSEYLASGRMVITSDVGDVPVYLRDGESALFVSGAATVAEIAGAVDRALASPELRRRVGEAGRAVALRHFDLPVVQETLQAMLDQVMKPRD
ncbi:MAG: glycosyltransferase family 4 protein [Kiritimatiellae bacterium]|nr:glycosyltransferase family 4 protein [Kiritimatiellia bacterium]